MTAASVRRGDLGRAAWPLGVLLAVAFGVATLALARRDPGGSFGGASTVGAVALLAGGWSLATAGALFWSRHPRNTVGPLLAAAGLAWFLPEWTSPETVSAVGFTAGLAFSAACVPLVAHAALAHPTGRLRSRAVAPAVAAAYAGAVWLLGIARTAAFDPQATGCFDCPRNLLLVHGDSDLSSALTRWGLRLSLASLAALVVACLWELYRRRGAAPVLVATIAYLALVAWELQHALTGGFLNNDAVAVRAWRWQSAALAALAVAVVWRLVRERRARGAVARFVVELARASRAGGVRDALARALGDDSVVLAYRRAGTDDYVDAEGKQVVPARAPGRVVTPLRRGELTVAALVHDERLLDEPGLLANAVAGAQLTLANEQLQAEQRAQLEDLAASRARIVEAGDAARRQLERDLHDGAQQRIVGIALAVQLLRSRLGDDPDPAQLRKLNGVAAKLDEALDELREVAHGLYPAVLSDQGLAAAVEMLAERCAPRVDVSEVVEGRLPFQVENAAYFVVSEAVKGAGHASVALSRTDRRLVVVVDRQGDELREPDRLQEIADRVGALDGRAVAERGVVRAEIPCAS